MNRMVIAIVTILGVTAAAGALSGCSVGMAASGKPDPNLTATHTGATRADIENALGPPVSSVTLANGDTRCAYEYEMGNEPSPGRAVAHGIADVMTLGIWEVVGTPIEAMQGQKYEMDVLYAPDGTAKEVVSHAISSSTAKRPQ
ncbi:MAG: hypothetical protein U1E45_13495 [Geminicoccaceae bacterium]